MSFSIKFLEDQLEELVKNKSCYIGMLGEQTIANKVALENFYNAFFLNLLIIHQLL